MQIKNKKVVVTGAASGIGKELCIAFQRHGAASICAVDVNLDGAQETAQQISGMSLFADVSKEEDIKNVVEETTKEFGGIDIFCSNAGIGGLPGFFESETTDWQKIWEINVQAHIHAAKHVLPQMLDRGEGYLVNTSSAAGLLTQLGASSYAVTKAAAVSFAEWIKITYGEKGIGVSCLCPQAVKTAMTAGGAGVAGVDGMMEPDAVAECVIQAINEEKFLVLPHQEVSEYVMRKGNDRDRWIKGMQRLQKQYEEFLTPTDLKK